MVFGYGYFDNVLVVYVLKYFDFVIMMFFVKGDLWMWVDGIQVMFEYFNVILEYLVECNVDIICIICEDGKVYIYIMDWDCEFDVFVFIVLLEKFFDYFDVDDDEWEYFLKIIYQQYMVDVCLVKEYLIIFGYVFDNMRFECFGYVMVYYYCWVDDLYQIIMIYLLCNYLDYVDKIQEECCQMVFDDMEIFGYLVEKIIEEQIWYYFLYVSLEDYKVGWYEKVEGMQGCCNIFYVGEIMSFGNFDEVCYYLKDLVMWFFV